MADDVSADVTSKEGQSVQQWRQPLLIHFKGVLAELGDKEPIGFLEGLARKDSKVDGITVTKLTSLGTWVPQRLIASNLRLFLLKPGADSSYEIVDSIPLHEIAGLSKADVTSGKSDSYQRGSDVPRGSEGPTSDDGKKDSEVTDGVTSVRMSKRRDSREASELGIFSNSCMRINTIPEGFNQGKVFVFDTATEGYCDQWLEELHHLMIQARTIYRRKHALQYIQTVAKQVYDSDLFQIGMVLSMGGNFFLAILHAQIRDENYCDIANSNSTTPPYMDPDPLARKWRHSYDVLAIFFTALFVAEITVNFIAHAWWKFWRDLWNCVDTLVIVISVGVIFTSTTNNIIIKQLRILRALRVAKFFGRIGNIRDIAVAVASSILPGAQALFIGLIVVAIYAIIGREFYGADHPQYFCDFFHAFYTMFGVVALGTVPIGIFDAGGRLIVSNAIFMYSYVAIVIFALLQVVVAVLLESFYKARQRTKEEAEAALEEALQAQLISSNLKIVSPLDPILGNLAGSFDTNANLDQRLRQLFDAFDVDRTGAVSFAEFAEGMFKATGTRPQAEEFDRLTEGGRLLNREAEIEFDHFRVILRAQLREYVQRKLADSQFDGDVPGDVQVLLNAMKMVMISLDAVAAGAVALRDGVDEQSVRLTAEVAGQGDMVTEQAASLEALINAAKVAVAARARLPPVEISAVCSGSVFDAARPAAPGRAGSEPPQPAAPASAAPAPASAAPAAAASAARFIASPAASARASSPAASATSAAPAPAASASAAPAESSSAASAAPVSAAPAPAASASAAPAESASAASAAPASAAPAPAASASAAPAESASAAPAASASAAPAESASAASAAPAIAAPAPATSASAAATAPASAAPEATASAAAAGAVGAPAQAAASGGGSDGPGGV